MRQVRKVQTIIKKINVYEKENFCTNVVQIKSVSISAHNTRSLNTNIQFSDNIDINNTNFKLDEKLAISELDCEFPVRGNKSSHQDKNCALLTMNK